MRDVIEDLIVDVICATAKIGMTCGVLYGTAWCMVSWF